MISPPENNPYKEFLPFRDDSPLENNPCKEFLPFRDDSSAGK